MKNVLKGMLYLSLCGAMLLTACEKDNADDETPQTSDNKAELVSFGFYKQDNPLLDADYVAENISKEIIIRLPEELFDNTELKGSLIARFTLGENDAMFVGATEQVSGTTANDYNYPVDFIVTDEIDNVNSSYTVRVGKVLEMEWNEIATIVGENNAVADELVMAINPKDGLPYFFYTDEYDLEGTMRDQGVVSKWDGSKIVTVGNTSFSGRVSTILDMKFGSNGTPYVFFAGYEGTTGNMPAVMKLEGSTWQLVGKIGYADRISSSLKGAMGIDASTNQPFTVHTTGYANYTLPRYTANYSAYNGSTWNSNQAFSMAGDQRVGNPKTIAVGNDTYLLYAMQNNIAGNADNLTKGYSLLKYSAGSWTKVVDNFCLSTNQSHFGCISMDTDSKGTIYCCFFDSSPEATWVMQVWKVEGSTFVKVGNSINLGVDAYSGELYSIAIDKDDVPHIICRNETDNSISLYKYDTETTQWGEPFVACANAGTDQAVQIAFNDEGIGYATYISRDETTKAYTYHILRGMLEKDILPE